jgi:hypothetical protein
VARSVRTGHARDRALNAILRRLADHYLTPVNALRAGLGLEPLGHLQELFLRSQRLILFTAEPLEYPRSDWPASVRPVGPLDGSTVVTVRRFRSLRSVLEQRGNALAGSDADAEDTVAGSASA